MVEVPNELDNIMSLWFVSQEPSSHGEGLCLNHACFFTRCTLGMVIEACGFEIINQTTYSRRFVLHLDNRIVGGTCLGKLLFVIEGWLNRGSMIGGLSSKHNER